MQETLEPHWSLNSFSLLTEKNYQAEMTLILFSHFRKLEKRRKKSILLLGDSGHCLNDTSRFFFLPLLNAWGCTQWPMATLWSEQRDTALKRVNPSGHVQVGPESDMLPSLTVEAAPVLSTKRYTTGRTLCFSVSSLYKQKLQRKNKSRGENGLKL